MTINIYQVEKAAIYARKSREDQKSLEGQIQSNKDWCLRNGITNVDIYKEEGSASSEDWDREELQKMIRNLKHREYDMVIVVDQFRICRTDDFHIFKELLNDVDCLFAATETNKVYNFKNENDEFQSEILTSVGKLQLTQIKKKLKRGIIQSAKRRNWVGKKVPV